MSTATNVDNALGTSPLSEEQLQTLVSDYYLHQVAQTRIDYIPLHGDGMITTPFEYRVGDPIVVQVSSVDEDVLCFSDLGAINEHLAQLAAAYSEKQYEAVFAMVKALAVWEHLRYDPVEGLYYERLREDFTPALGHFIQAVVKLDGLVRCLLMDASFGRACLREIKGGGL